MLVPVGFIWLHCFGPEAKQNIVVEWVCGVEEAAHFTVARKQREERSRDKIHSSQSYSQLPTSSN
jgi:hypothetical protein